MFMNFSYIVLAAFKIEWYHILICVAVVLAISYIVLIIVSCCFMHIFNNKMKKSSETISIFIFQKEECMAKIINLLGDVTTKQKILSDFFDNFSEKSYVVLSYKEFGNKFAESREINKEIKLIYTNIKGLKNKNQIDALFLSINELNTGYNEETQLYNSYVVAYNYWRNLFMTRWIKDIFKIKEKEQIK